MKIIEVKNFSFRYANGNRNSLENVTLDVEEVTFNVLCGKSGCGKSTLLRQLKSDLAPCGSRSGRICFMARIWRRLLTDSRARKSDMYCRIRRIRS